MRPAAFLHGNWSAVFVVQTVNLYLVRQALVEGLEATKTCRQPQSHFLISVGDYLTSAK